MPVKANEEQVSFWKTLEENAALIASLRRHQASNNVDHDMYVDEESDEEFLSRQVAAFESLGRAYSSSPMTPDIDIIAGNIVSQQQQPPPLPASSTTSEPEDPELDEAIKQSLLTSLHDTTEDDSTVASAADLFGTSAEEQTRLLKEINEEQRKQREVRLEQERIERINELKPAIDAQFNLENVRGDNNCYYRAVARLLSLFGYTQEHHIRVRESVIDHILGVLNDPNHILHLRYHDLLDNILLEPVESLVSRLLKIGTVEGWGGFDITPFVANAFLVDVSIFNMNDGLVETVEIDAEFAASQRLPEPDSRVPINLWYSGAHYQVLILK